MTRTITARNSIVATVLVAPLVLGACGKHEEASAPAESSSSAPSSVVATTTQTAGSETGSPSATPGPDTSASGGPDAPGAAPHGPAVSPNPGAAPAPNIPGGMKNNDLSMKTSPVAGSPASPEDTKEITNLMHHLVWANTTREYVTNWANATCSKVIEQQGGPAAMDPQSVPDLPMDQMPAGQGGPAKVDAVDNVRVDGENASATVTSTSNGQTSTGNVLFHREGGSWKVCN